MFKAKENAGKQSGCDKRYLRKAIRESWCRWTPRIKTFLVTSSIFMVNSEDSKIFPSRNLATTQNIHETSSLSASWIVFETVLATTPRGAIAHPGKSDHWRRTSFSTRKNTMGQVLNLKIYIEKRFWPKIETIVVLIPLPAAYATPDHCQLNSELKPVTNDAPNWPKAIICWQTDVSSGNKITKLMETSEEWHHSQKSPVADPI